MRRVIFLFSFFFPFFVFSQSINWISPTIGEPGQNLSVTISGTSVDFGDYWTPTDFRFLNSGNPVLYGQSLYNSNGGFTGNNYLYGNVNIPINQPPGHYTLQVFDLYSMSWVQKPNAFTIATYGCIDTSACNYDLNALFDDGSCIYDTFGSSSDTACDSYTWDGTVYTVSGLYTKLYVNAVGCDSIHTLDLTINQGQGDPYVLTLYDSYGDGWNGNSLNINTDNYAIADVNGDYNTTNVWMQYPNGYEVSFLLCLDLLQCIDVIYNPTGVYFSENSWNIINDSGTIINSGIGISGGSASNIGICLGCTDPLAMNYEPNLDGDDGSCLYPGCTDPSASNFDFYANFDDGSCIASLCNGPAITGLYVSDIIDDRVVLNFDNMNSYDSLGNQICRVDQIRIKYRKVGVNTWNQKNIGSPTGYDSNTGVCNSTQKINKNLYGLTLDTEYEWEVKVWYCTDQTTGWVQGPNFTTASECPNARNTNAYGVNPTKARFTWDASNGVYEFFRIKIRLDSISNPSVSDFINVGGAGIAYGTFQKDKNGLNPGETYRGQGRTWCSPNGGAYNSLGWTPFLPWTQPTNRIKGADAIKNLDIYPNPSNDIFNISFISEGVQDLRIVVRNVIGEELIVDNLQKFVGEYTKTINLKDNSRGVYFLEILTNDKLINKKLVLQ